MSDYGYIKLHRKIWESGIFNDGERFNRVCAWIWILTHVYYKETNVMIKGSPYKIQRGQMLVSIRYLAGIWHWDSRTVMRYLKVLENEKMITRTRTSYATLLTVCNYSKYQGSTDSDSEEYNTESNTESNSEYNTEYNNLKNIKKGIKKEKKDTRGGRMIE